MMRSLLFIVLFSLSNMLWAQNYGEVKGRIIDDNNLPLSAAKLNVIDQNAFTYADNNGFYSIKKLEPGAYQLQVSYFGFEDQTVEFDIAANKTTILNIKMEKGINLSEIQVVGSLTGTAKAINQQRNMVNVGNIISAEQVNQFPDDNMGDALKRVPGVNVQYDQGEARFGNIRGTAPDLSAVTLDGDRLPSAEGETRAFQLDLIPADLVQSIEVNKVVTPDMDGDAIGASVNLVTRSIPEERRLRVDVSSGYNNISEKLNYKSGFLYADRVLNNKLGFTITASTFNNYIGSENYEAEWSEDGGKNNALYVEDYQLRKYDLQRLRENYTAALDYKFNNNHRIEISGSYNQRDDYENRMRLRYKKIKWDDDVHSYMADIERETKGGTKKDARLEKQKLKNIKINGEHDFKFMEMDWGLMASSASEERPHERYITMASKDKVAVNQNITDPREVEFMAANASNSNIGGFELDEVTEEYQWTEEKNKVAYLNLNFPLSRGQYSNDLKLGIKIKSKDKERDNKFYEYAPIDEDAFTAQALGHIQDYSDDDFQAIDLSIGQFVTPAFLGQINLNNGFEKEEDIEELAGNYEATENIQAAYIRFDQHIGDKWLFVGGLRLERTDIEYNGYITDIDEGQVVKTKDEERDYTNFMPSILIKYSPAKLWNIKFAVTNTIARPRYFDLVPYQIINQEDMEIEVGNPQLDPTKSLNLDLMVEKYFKHIGLIEAGIFYKDISDFIVDERYDDYLHNGQTWDKFKRPINGGDASLLGMEIGFQRPLDFISSQLKDFSIYANYTYIHSEVDNFNIEDREDEDLSLSGTPEHTLNASLAYNTPKVEARLSYNYASDFIDEFGKSSFYDRYYDAVDYLDFNLGYNFSNHINAYIKINNILNQPLRYFQGEEDRTMQVEYYGVKYKMGIQFNL